MKKQQIIIVAIVAITLLAFAAYKTFRNVDPSGPEGQESAETDPGNYLVDSEWQNMDPSQTIRPIGSGDHIMGGEGNKLDLIVYLDLSGSLSRDYYATLRQLPEIYGEDIRLAIRQFFPQNNSLSYEMAASAECAARLGGTEAYYGVFDYFLTESNIFVNTDESISMLAENIAIDGDEFSACLESADLKTAIKAQLDEADSFGVIGSPTTFVGSELLPGAYPLEDFTDSGDRSREGLHTIIKGYLGEDV